jgi:hypothetical protein
MSTGRFTRKRQSSGSTNSRGSNRGTATVNNGCATCECGEHRDSGIELDVCDTEDGKPVVLCLACLDKADGLFEENEVW